MFICMQKINFISLTSFARYYKYIANFLFWEFWECLFIPINYHCINLKETFMLICIQKITLLYFFLEIFQRNTKLVILGNLGKPGHTHKNHGNNLKKPLMLIHRQNIGFTLHVFLEIL